MAQITKLALKDSLMKLLEEEPLDKITIKDIVDKCGLNRNTFYYHFQDIYDLISFIFVSESKDIIEESKLYTDWEENFLRLTNYLNSHKKMIYHIYNSINREQLENYLYDVVDDLLTKVINHETKGCLEKENLQTIVDFYKYAFVGYILHWIKYGMKTEPEYMIKQINYVLMPSLSGLLQNV